jgi:hypothetical protein
MTDKRIGNETRESQRAYSFNCDIEKVRCTRAELERTG